MSLEDPEGYASQAPADFIFEADPDPAVFDGVRRGVVRRIEEQHTDVFAVDIREHVRIDVIEVHAGTWHVSGVLDGRKDVDFEISIRAEADANAALIDYLRAAVDRRFAPAVDADAVSFKKIGMRPRAWFVDAVIPQTQAD